MGFSPLGTNTPLGTIPSDGLIKDVSGAVQAGQFTVSGSLEAGKVISGGVTAGSSAASGALSATRFISGNAASDVSAASGSLTAVKTLSGSATSGSSTISGETAAGQSNLTGNTAAGPSSVSVTVSRVNTLTGGVAASAATVSVTLSTPRIISGAVSASASSVTGTASVKKVVSEAVSAGPSTIVASAAIDLTVTLALSITQNIVSSNDTLSFQIVQDIYSYGTLTATIESDITGYTSGTLSLQITQNITSGSGTLSLQITQSIVPPITPVVAGSGRWWTAKVYLDSVDVSPNLTATITIDAEVNAASIATFTLKPTAGTVNPFAWVKKPVRIDYQETDSTGAVQATYTLFNGVVDTPLYNPTTRLTTFDCTDGMQKKFEAMSKSVIDSIIPGYWHEAVFDKDADPWSYALDLLSTIPYDMDINVIGNIVLTPWLAKTTADYSFGMGNILDGSLSVSLANSRDLINDYEVSFDYRYELYRERGVRYSWYMDPGVMSADFVVYSPDMPFGQAFIDAVESAGLTFTQAPHLIPLPVSGNYLVYGLSGGAQVILWGNDNPDGIMGAQGHCSVRYSQTVTEKRVSRVYSPQSVEQLSSIKSTLSASLEADYGDALDGFDETVEMQESHANNASAVATSSSGNVIPYAIGGSVTTTYNGYANDYSALATTLDRETVYDFSSLMVSGDRPDADSAAEVLLNVASTDILNSHRRNTVSFTTLLCPYLDRIHTVRVDTDTVTAKGKVRQIVHSMDIDAGSALTECTLAISLTSAVGIPPSPPVLAPPTEEDMAPATATDYASVVSLPTYVAGLSGAFDEDMTGWIAQSDAASEGYSNSFVIPFDGVDDANLQEQEIQYEDSFEVIIPVDELLLEA